MRLTLCLVLLVILFQACNSAQPSISVKDSLLIRYLKYVDSTRIMDSSDSNYYTLKAYVNNDTTRIKQMIVWAENQVRKREFEKSYSETLVHQEQLQDMNVDEAYRFIYRPPFCDTKINVTITKKEKQANLHFILYENYATKPSKRIINEYDKTIPLKDWTEFEQSMFETDFWGLRKDNEIRGLDGDNMVVYGYKQVAAYPGEYRFNTVTRWGSTNPALEKALDLLLLLSENKQGCYIVQRKHTIK